MRIVEQFKKNQLLHFRNIIVSGSSCDSFARSMRPHCDNALGEYAFHRTSATSLERWTVEVALISAGNERALTFHRGRLTTEVH